MRTIGRTYLAIVYEEDAQVRSGKAKDLDSRINAFFNEYRRAQDSESGLRSVWEALSTSLVGDLERLTGRAWSIGLRYSSRFREATGEPGDVF